MAVRCRPATGEVDAILKAENPRYNRVLGKREDFLTYLRRPHAQAM